MGRWGAAFCVCSFFFACVFATAKNNEAREASRGTIVLSAYLLLSFCGHVFGSSTLNAKPRASKKVFAATDAFFPQDGVSIVFHRYFFNSL